MNSATIAIDNSANANNVSEYDAWAWLYDQTVGPDYDAPQWHFLQRVLLSQLPARSELLDMCCGTGQLMRRLQNAGYQVTGLDNSASMLECARRNAPGAQYVLDDARYFDINARFDGVICTSASLNHIESIGDLEKVFSRVHASLLPGGIFVFDLNHPRQMERWWRGVPHEGDIGESHAWLITPRYDALAHRGAFRVTIYRAGDAAAGLLRPLKSRLYTLLNKPRFIGLRLKLLQRFGAVEPGWQRQDIDYPVTGHELAAVTNALRIAGFADVRCETIDGDRNVDENHSAHFICRRARR